jgi:hypothetical protein
MLSVEPINLRQASLSVDLQHSSSREFNTRRRTTEICDAGLTTVKHFFPKEFNKIVYVCVCVARCVLVSMAVCYINRLNAL